MPIAETWRPVRPRDFCGIPLDALLCAMIALPPATAKVADSRNFLLLGFIAFASERDALCWRSPPPSPVLQPTADPGGIRVPCAPPGCRTSTRPYKARSVRRRHIGEHDRAEPAFPAQPWVGSFGRFVG